MVKQILNKYMQGDKRTVLLKKNILGSFFIKGWTCLVQLLLVPVTLNCLNQYEYGIWLTINSLLIWIDSFDIGLGNGLRNRLAASIAINDVARARRQVSTAFFMLVLIILPTIVLFTGIIHHTDCYSLLNVDGQTTHNLESILTVSYIVVAMTFIFKFVGNVYMALQLPAISNLLIAIGQTLSLVLIFVASRFMNVTLLHVAVIYTASPLLVYLLSYPITFTKYKTLAPSIALFDRTELQPLFGLGVKFFFIQIGGLIIFASSNLLISKLFSPKEVTPYQIAHRYFGLVNILFTIISAPLWSATTDAYMRKDWQWIRHTTRKMRKVMAATTALLLAMAAIAHPVYTLWVGSEVEIPSAMSVAMMAYMVVVIYGTCYSNFICGIGKIRLLTIITIAEALMYIPLAVWLSQRYGVIGIVIALILVNLVSAIINHVQFSKLCNNTAKSIWNL